MLQKTTTTSARLVTSLAYCIESFRVKLGRKEFVDPLQNVYLKYVELVRHKEFNPQETFPNHQIFLEFRKVSDGKLTLIQEQYLMELLNYKLAKWFVPHVLNVSDHFSVKLMNKLIDTALKIKDPHSNFHFMSPAIRVFDLRVNLELHSRFTSANLETKKRILSIFPRIKSRRKTRINKAGEVENYGIKFSWSGTKFENIGRMNAVDFIQYCQSEKLIYDARLKLLLDEYFKSTRIEMKYAVSWYLPNEIKAFPPTLRIQANDFLNMLK